MSRPGGIGQSFTLEELKAQFKGGSRLPFIEVLSHMMKCAPTEKAIEYMAEEDPSKWANTVRVMAKLAGYHDKLEVTENINILIGQLGDSALLERINELDALIIDMNIEEVGLHKKIPPLLEQGDDSLMDEEGVLVENLET